MASTNKDLRKIQSFESLVRYLEDELDWPLNEYDFEDVVFSYEPEELGLKDADAAKIKRIYQMRPLESGQPWGIFLIEFENRKLPVAVLRRILNHLVVKKRASANKADRAAWNTEDLLFISAFGEKTEEDREIAFAHFHEEQGDKPTLRVLGWDGSDTPLKLEHVAHELRDKLHWPANIRDKDAWRKEWSGAFRHKIGHVIRTASDLAEVLATLAKKIRNAAQILMKAESDNGRLTKLYTAFKAALIHDLTSEGFADTYAQTITYGLLTAAISRTEWSEGRYGTSLVAEDMAEMVPVTNPFLKDMLQTFLKAGGRKGGIDFDELGVQDVVELLRGDETDLPAVIRDFGNKKPGEDPVIHFYEHFLSAYNKKLKIQRGVFYTPQPVVSYIVRSVHELLQTEFGIEDGLASTITWAEMLAKNPELKLPMIVITKGEKNQTVPIDHSTPFVQILDPATGTGTFLVEVIDVIHKTLEKKWNDRGLSQSEQRAAWNEYVPKHLLPRLHGYELMMAPYAIAHMKIGLKLVETGYRFLSDERARIYLTNSLEPPQDFSDRLEFDAPALAHEAQSVNKIKRHQRFSVIIGNPPYARDSANRSKFAESLVEIYKQDVRTERNIQPLSDDYVKFMALSQFLIAQSGVGIVGLVTNHSYIRGLIHRGLRHQLCQFFDGRFFLDLHGNANIQEQPPFGVHDENVFDILQGVSIACLTRTVNPDPDNRALHFAELWGTRAHKGELLFRNQVTDTAWAEVTLRPPEYGFLVVEDSSMQDEYDAFTSLQDWFPISATGFITHRDGLVIDFDRSALRERIQRLNSKDVPDSALIRDYGLKDNRDWKIVSARKQLRKVEDPNLRIVRCTYRPFDSRWCWWGPELMDFPRPELAAFFERPNLTLLCKRQNKKIPFSYAFVATEITESCTFESAHANNVAFPLFSPGGTLLTEGEEHSPNIGSTIVSQLIENLGLRLISRSNGDLDQTIGPRDLMNYVYSLLHSTGYRMRYEQCLVKSFPRLPLTNLLDLFRVLARLGDDLVALHLMESPKLDTPITEFIGGKNPEVEKISYSDNTVWIDKAKTVGFAGVSEAVWNFHIGGYQVCDKWLKDRKGRKLLNADISHYHKIIVALHETIHLMREIDEVIEAHGGWPLK